MLRFRLHRPGLAPQVVAVAADAATIGRAPECDVPIDDPEVSRRHTRVLHGVVVIDLGSRNGTWIGEQRLGEAARLPALRFTIGQGERAIAVEVEPGEESAAAGEESDATLTAGALRAPAGPAPAAAPPAAPSPAAAPAGDLALLHRELDDTRRRLSDVQRELAETRQARDAKQATAGSELAEARLEIVRLNQRIGSLKSELETSSKASGEAVASRLAQERVEASERRAAELERRVRELEAQPPAAPPAPAAGQPMSDFVTRMQREVFRLQQENAQLKARGGAAAPAAVPAPALAAAPVAAPARPAAAAGRLDLAPLHGREIERFQAPPDAQLHDFVLVEAVRFLRAVERVVAYSAREFVAVLEMQTMLPDHDRNFAERLRELAAAPADPALRTGLEQYLRELSRWLVAGLASYKNAAKEFALGVKRSLSEEALCADAPIPTFKRLAGQADAELWKRATQVLAELSPDLIDDRIERLARETAQRVLDGSAAGAGDAPAT